MTALRVLWSRLCGIVMQRRLDAQLNDEIQTHLELLADEHMRCEATAGRRAVYDGPTVGGVCVVIAGAALLAAYLPARSASRIDPTVALRSE